MRELDQAVDLAAITQELVQLHWRGEHREMLALAERTWPQVEGRWGDPDAGQLCRLAMLAHFRAGEYAKGDVWKARALAYFVAAGSGRGVAVVVLSLALRAIDLDDGGGGNLAFAVHMLELMGPLNAAPDQAPVTTISFEDVERHRFEKLGYVYARSGRFSEAVAAYRRALEIADDGVRTRLKLEGGLALALWLSDPSGATAKDAIATLEEVRAEGKRLGLDVGEVAAASLARIARGGARAMADFDPHFDIR